MNLNLVFILDLGSHHGLALRLREALGSRFATELEPLGEGNAEEAMAALGRRINGSLRRQQPEVLLPCLPADGRKQAERFFAMARSERWDLPVLVASQDARAEELEALVTLGAADFVTEPFSTPDLQARLERLRHEHGTDEPVILQLKAKLGLRHLVGSSPRFLAMVRKIPAIARGGTSALILGETGTGKELCARGIHHLSPRAHKPFVPVNCGAIPTELVENELFGHTQGAYTGAASPATGLVQAADGGTLFLDEVDCLPLPSQVKLLRFLQEREYRPVGAAKALHADVRVVAASNSDLPPAVRAGRFRQDLFYRLNVVSLCLPPLRERPEDIPELAHHFLQRFGAEQGKALRGFTPAALQQLLLHDWPGNVRELQNVIERAVVFAEDSQVRVTDLDLPAASQLSEGDSFQAMKAKAVAQFERACLQGLLAASGGNISAAARAARKNRRAFWQLIRKHRLVPKPVGQSPVSG